MRIMRNNAPKSLDERENIEDLLGGSSTVKLFFKCLSLISKVLRRL